jgi:mono/diheme cytochrome c family protein
VRIAALLLGLALALALAACGGDDGGEASAPPPPPPPAETETTETGTGAAADGAAVFASAGCGGCHTLAAAGSSGSVGPTLDGADLTVEAVASQVRNGGGAMPAFDDSLSEDEIQAVAEFVSEASAG